MATMIYDIPALPGLDTQSWISCATWLSKWSKFKHRVDRHPPEALEFLDDAILMDISSEGGLCIPLPTSKTRRA
jgi:hypothetical protein